MFNACSDAAQVRVDPPGPARRRALRLHPAQSAPVALCVHLSSLSIQRSQAVPRTASDDYRLLSSSILSHQMGCLVLVVFAIYDVFAVFVTPLIVKVWGQIFWRNSDWYLSRGSILGLIRSVLATLYSLVNNITSNICQMTLDLTWNELTSLKWIILSPVSCTLLTRRDRRSVHGQYLLYYLHLVTYGYSYLWMSLWRHLVFSSHTVLWYNLNTSLCAINVLVHDLFADNIYCTTVLAPGDLGYPYVDYLWIFLLRHLVLVLIQYND